MSPELLYLGLLFFLLVVPKALQRFRIPSAITAFLLGIAAARLGVFMGDPALALLATLGISGLFLFAGLEVDGADLRRGAVLVGQHLAIYAALMLLAARGLMAVFDLGWRPATLLALGLVTPSTGFILDALAGWGLSADERFWTRTKAIATELVALAVLFAVLQSTTPVRFALASGALVGLALVIPALMRGFAVLVAPWAPRSEFAFLVMLAVLAAFATRELGVYYLVGAFLVGVAARRFRDRLPAFSSERMLTAVEVFASFFAPFYFFSAGTHLDAELLGWRSFALGAVWLLLVVPVRAGLVLVHRRASLGEAWTAGRRVAIALVPTLVFSLVLAQLAAAQPGVPPYLPGSVVVYALVNTLVPAFVFHSAVAFDAPTLEPPGSSAEPARADVPPAGAPPA